MQSAILTPVIALITWTLIVWLWMYALRIPAMSKANIQPDEARHPGSLEALPSKVRAVADNYNHLHEQPTIFYALCFYLALSQAGEGAAVTLAWAYVGLRVVHSVVQNTGNKVEVRFTVFVLCSLVLMAMTALALLAL